MPNTYYYYQVYHYYTCCNVIRVVMYITINVHCMYIKCTFEVHYNIHRSN